MCHKNIGPLHSYILAVILITWPFISMLAIVLFWIWYGYNQLKAENYIDWRPYGMKQCYFCKRDEATYVGESYNKENSF